MSKRIMSQSRAIGAWLLIALAVFCLAPPSALAEVKPENLPKLTGRVVDDANVLNPAQREALRVKLKTLEDRSGIQFVVATVPSLQGEEIEPYANALFRAWQLGEKDKNNGLLFLIAPTERKIRFETGYGLEGTVTDALTKLILRNAVGPKLKTGDYAGGITAGVDEAIAIMTTDKSSWQKRPALRQTAGTPQKEPANPVVAGFIFLIFLFVLIMIWRNRRNIDWTSAATGAVLGSTFGGGGRGESGGGGDSFSGGGGDSGGGGSSDSY
jgi:uncharacterized protein